MTRTSFNDGWRFRPKGSLFEELAPGAATPPVEVRAPHDAMIGEVRDPDGASAAGYFPGGVWEYLKDFDVPAEWSDNRVWFDFEAVYRDAQVFVNRDFAGQWAYGYSSFLIDATPFLKPGETNTIEVDCRTAKDSRWYTGAGLIRGVNLIVKPRLHITPFGVTVTTPQIEDGLAVVAVAASVTNDSATTRTATVRMAIADPDGAPAGEETAQITLAPGETGCARGRIVVRNPRLWSVDSPALYQATTELLNAQDREAAASDAETTSFGIRTLRLDPDHGLRVNGESVKLRGACVHHDNGPLGAAGIARAEERRVEGLKAAGFNAIRASHNPLSRAMLDACDRLGMLVMDEAFDMWTQAKSPWDYAHDFPAWWERDIEAMVTKDRNHPSVVMYSIGNEIPDLGSGLGSRWGRRLAEKIRELDPTRYVTNGVNCLVAGMDALRAMAAQAGMGENAGVNTFMSQMGDMMNTMAVADFVTDAIAESASVLDVLGLNYADARYELEGSLHPNRVVMGSETFPTHIAENWRLVTAHAQVLGDFTWTGWDYLGEAGIGGLLYASDGAPTGSEKKYPWLTAWCGDIDITGWRRPQSYYREIVFGLRTEPYIAAIRPATHGQDSSGTPWSWSDSIASWTWPGFEGEPISVEVYADADEVELLLDGVVLASAKVGDAMPFRADFETEYRPGELVAIAYRGGVECGRTALASAGPELELRAVADRSVIAADDRDLAYVALELSDGAGRLRTDADRSITVSVSGPAVLAALGSGNPATVETFSTASHETFDGRALAILRPTGPGEITLTATADGCEPTTVTVTSR